VNGFYELAILKAGKSAYVDLSNYNTEQTARAVKLFKVLRTPFVIHEPRYYIFDRWVEDGLLNMLMNASAGSIAFAPLAKGV